MTPPNARTGVNAPSAPRLNCAARPPGRSAAHAFGRVLRTIAREPRGHGRADRSEFGERRGRAPEPAGALGIDQQAALDDPERIEELVGLDAVEIAEAEVADVDGREPGIRHGCASAARVHEEQ